MNHDVHIITIYSLEQYHCLHRSLLSLWAVWLRCGKGHEVPFYACLFSDLQSRYFQLFWRFFFAVAEIALRVCGFFLIVFSLFKSTLRLWWMDWAVVKKVQRRLHMFILTVNNKCEWEDVMQLLFSGGFTLQWSLNSLLPNGFKTWHLHLRGLLVFSVNSAGGTFIYLWRNPLSSSVEGRDYTE